MTALELIAIVAIAFAASGLGAVAGGTSLFTVPALILFGVEPHVAVATNIAGLTALSAAASLRFARAGAIPTRPTLALAALSLPAGAVGAGLALSLPERTLEIVVGTAMLALAAVVATRSRFGAQSTRPTTRAVAIGYLLALALGVYSGFFSGGYTTMMTVLLVACFGTSLITAVASTKVVNFVSSAAATAVFASAGAISPALAAVLIPTMAAGGLAGAHFVVRLPPERLRSALALIVAILAALLLIRPLIFPA